MLLYVKYFMNLFLLMIFFYMMERRKNLIFFQMDVKINYVKKVLKLRKGFEERKNLKISQKYQILLLWFFKEIIFKVKIWYKN